MKREIINSRSKVALLVAGIFLAIAMAGVNSYAGTLSVNSNADTYTCDNLLTLREAIMLARGNGFDRPLTDAERNLITGGTYIAAPPPVGCPFGAYWSITNGIGGSDDDTIRFTTAVNTISTEGMPIIWSGGDTIDGLRGDGVKVALSGVNAGDRAGFWVDIHGAQASRGLTIRNMYIRDFQRQGIYIQGGLNGVYQGLDIRACGLDGIAVVPIFETFGTYNPRNNRIGGPDTTQRNYIYGNGGNGIAFYISPTGDRYPNLGNVIENNYIGLSLNGPEGNGANGIYLENAFGTLVGGETTASRNVISANHANGILLTQGGTYANRVINNFIGTGIDGTSRMGNAFDGIRIDQGAGAPSAPNLIGEAGKGNVISANGTGIAILGSATNNTVILGNFIGVDIAGNRNDLGNLGAGIFDSNAHDNTIGGPAAGEENFIAYNGARGVYATGSTAGQIAIRANRIFLNNLLGIDLDPVGVSLNDPLDQDYGPNGLQNFPLIHTGSSGGGFTNLSGSINSSRNINLILDFFINPDSDPSGYGEGSFYIGSRGVVTDNNGFADFNASFNTVLNYSGYYATATATGPEGTSEFSFATRIGCSYSISPTGQNFSSAGGSGSFNVTTTAACDWQAVSNASWVQITGGGSGTGNGTVSFSVAANTGPARVGTITVGGRLFTITQDSLCTYSLSRTSASYTAAGTPSDSLNVTAGNNCTWTAVSNASWIAVTSGGSGTGNGTVVWAVAANTGAARQGTIMIAGLTFTIDQASGCVYSLVSNMASYPASGGTDGNSVITESSCEWTAVSNVSWVTITSGANSVGTGPFTYSVDANLGPARVGTLTVAGSTYTISQASGCGYQLDHYSASYPANGTASDTVGVLTVSGCPWTAVSNVPWVTITGGSTGTGPGPVTFSVGANPGAVRQGTLTIAGLTFTISQGAATIIFVNSTAQAPGSVGDCTLGEAIQAANIDAVVDGCNPGSGPDLISLPAGTYTLTTVAIAHSFVGNVGLPGITSHIGIQGAGIGSTIIERAPAAVDQFRLMAITNQNGGSIVLNDLTMRGGRSGGQGPAAAQGGALYTFGRPATLDRVVFDDNRAATGGAAVTSDQGGVLVANDCVFTNNQATAGNGGAIVSGQVTISDSTFTNNSAFNGGALYYVQGGGANFNISDSTFTNNQTTVSGGTGGSIRVNGAATVTSSQFTGNSAGQSGSSGGAVSAMGTLNLIDSVVTGNQANYGGGLHLENCSVTIAGSTISNNAASTHFGGGIYHNHGSAVISGSAIMSNTAGIDGGGLWQSDVDAGVVNTTIGENNAVRYGGGILIQAFTPKTLNLTNVTIVKNQASLEGGGLLRFHEISAVRAKNSLIALNTTASHNAPDIYAPTAFTSLGYNLIGIRDGATIVPAAGDQIGTGSQPIDPKILAVAGLNGGTTPNYALQPDSPAVDKGGASAPPLATDQRGFVRPYDSPAIPNATGGNGSDIGAFERQENDVTSKTLFDFDGDGKADLSIFRPVMGEWYYRRSSNGVTNGFGFGISTDKPVPADLTGDGKTDIAFFRPSTSEWYVLRSEDSTFYAFPFGANGDITAPADYDGDGRADATVYRPSAQTWFILRSTGGVLSVPFGLSNDIPVPADYDGDGRADVGIYRPSLGQWWYLKSSNGSVFAATFGVSTDKPLPGDYTGDGRADVAFYRPSEGNWYVLRSEDSTYYAFPFGNSTDKPAPADYDGDGKFDAAVFRPSNTNWYILKSTGGVQIQQFGLANDIPLPGAFVP